MVANDSRYTPEQLGAILALLDSATRLSRFHLVDRDTEIRLTRAATGAFADPAVSPPGTAAPLPGPHPHGQDRAPAAATFTLRSPTVGTFRRSNARGDPFVTVGIGVGPDSIIGNIEVIRDMMAVAATTSGTVTAIMVADGEPIEFGQPLLTIEPSR
jgi:acetyl-CoA carboxylase biotin carboxyl carrier protein